MTDLTTNPYANLPMPMSTRETLMETFDMIYNFKSVFFNIVYGSVYNIIL